jgi:hypothetical protein
LSLTRVDAGSVEFHLASVILGAERREALRRPEDPAEKTLTLRFEGAQLQARFAAGSSGLRSLRSLRSEDDGTWKKSRANSNAKGKR